MSCDCIEMARNELVRFQLVIRNTQFYVCCVYILPLLCLSVTMLSWRHGSQHVVIFLIVHSVNHMQTRFITEPSEMKLISTEHVHEISYKFIRELKVFWRAFWASPIEDSVTWRFMRFIFWRKFCTYWWVVLNCNIWDRFTSARLGQ